MESLLLPISVLSILSFAVSGTEYSPQGCSDLYYRYTPTHTACIRKETTPNGRVDWSSMTDEDRQLIVSTHNHYRGNVHHYNGGKRASNMLPMSYDRELENIAQLWAANCMFAHDDNNNRYVPGKYNVGQNLALGTPNWDSTLALWHSEVELFSYGSATPSSVGAVGHYTQMVWAESTSVGCGVQICNGTRRFYVCNYAPVGNIADRLSKPYKTGDVREDCPLRYNNDTGLCECAQSLCYNGGVVDTKSCTCNCPRANWLQPDNCAMMCGRAVDHPSCEKWGKSYCTRYTNVKAEYCPKMCNVCNGQDKVAAPKPPITTTTESLPAVYSRKQKQSTSVPSTTEKGLEPVLSYCKKEEPALCGQPNSKTGYLPRTVCLSDKTATICPAMCGLCTAKACRDYADNSYNTGESWINMYGRFTCTESGVQLERGCQTEDRNDIVPVHSTRDIQYNNSTYSCRCEADDGDEGRQRLHCAPVAPEEPARPGLEACDRIEGARCGLPKTQGRYWHKAHCTLRVVRRLCPAMCRLCAAKQCRMYNGTVVDVNTETQDHKNSMFVCTVNGWSIGPAITIDYNHTTPSVFVEIHVAANSISSIDGTSVSATTTTTTTVYPSPLAVTLSPINSIASSTTVSPQDDKAATIVSYNELLNRALVDDPYIDDYLEGEEDESAEDYIDIDVFSTTTTDTPTTADEGSGHIQEFFDYDTEPELHSSAASSTTTSTTTTSTTTPSTSTTSTTTTSTTTPSTSTTSTSTTSTSTTSTTTTSTSTTSTSTTGTPTTRREETTPTPVIGTTFASIRADQHLIDVLYPNKSVQCTLPDRAYCNQPLSGNVSLTFAPEDCSGNPLFCPGLCGLCIVTSCKDYSNQVYSIGQSWYSMYARLVCTSHGVVAQRGCYYEMLRQFIDAGETLSIEDGFLTHNCQCDVSLRGTVWSHDLKCTTSVDSSQRITVATTQDVCQSVDDHRCVDPYYTPSDCNSIHVSSVCGAMCGKCVATQCRDSYGRMHAVGDSWVNSDGKIVCTENGMSIVRGCRYTQRDTFIEVGTTYSYNQSGVLYTCQCEKVSEYRYQLTCAGQRRRDNSKPTTASPEPTTGAKYPCRRVDNPKCGQLSREYWSEDLCTGSSTGWRAFMARVCPALCQLCKAKQCRGYDRKVYSIGDTWLSGDRLHRCTINGIRQI